MDKIICVGKNYAAHTAEMNEPQPARPILFLKPPSCMTELKDKGNLRLLWDRGVIHHECEVVLKLYKKNVIAVGLGLDLTLRELQKELKTNGHPWEISKCFKHSALVTPLKGQRDFPTWRTETFRLKVNGETRQESALPNAIFSPDEVILHANNFFPMNDGDLVFTGTPAGVGPLNPGDLIELQWGPINLSTRLIE